jgi:integrase
MNRKRPNGGGSIYQRKDGRWEAAAYVLTTAGTRKRIRVYAHTWEEANKALAKALADHHAGLPVADDAEQTLADFLTYWLEHVAAHTVRETTHAQYERSIRQHITPFIGRKKLARLTPKDVRTWLTTLRKTCQCCALGKDAARKPSRRNKDRAPRCCAIGACCRQTLAPRTLQYAHAVLASALNHAVREDQLPRNVAKLVPIVTGRPVRFEPLTLDEARRLLAATRAHRLHALFELALRTGLRRGELLGLRWRDIDLDAETLNVRRTLQRSPERGLVFLPPKTKASERRLALPTECVHALKQHREQQAAEREAAGTAWKEQGLVFPTRVGTPIDPCHLREYLNARCDAAGVRHIRFHDLRHSCATLLLEQGVELVTIKELLGHAHIGVTADIHAHVRLRLQHDAVNRLSDALRTDEEDQPPTHRR